MLISWELFETVWHINIQTEVEATEVDKITQEEHVAQWVEMEMKFWGVQVEEEPENEKAKWDKCGTRREWHLWSQEMK